MENDPQDNDLPDESEHASNWSCRDNWESNQMVFKKISSHRQSSKDAPQVGVAIFGHRTRGARGTSLPTESQSKHAAVKLV
eukprot:15299858-Ditylum_brightwellii.AAC.1